ncbi:hypothetical protein C3Y87_19455 [Carbonactinospora thermoautotrophica]|uniref:Uncharacterized protein n=1 Tax=Carbonactinospora thermoautotrophica TaxID=1469144 RepID=A0A132MKI9_9ACTN|nr:hypothetical protein [Carbonactinospora thermoautotrophica]KWW97911.1 hypothetical protein TH66_21260 [Carbonactinospora thermoautotrophica]KWX07019.1 hypothetical protein TR74_20150 [Carbonactinospora thermoautotrophica]MCX9193528.1 hypothetical protein [Carbonactinospora thermoautotrophica]
MSIPGLSPQWRDLERWYNVVLPDALGNPMLGFRDGCWFSLTAGSPAPLTAHAAIKRCPDAASTIVQVICWWMREHRHHDRALDLATELALAVGDLARLTYGHSPIGNPSPLSHRYL